MSRLTIDTPSRADLVMEQLYKDLERRIESSPPAWEGCPSAFAEAARFGSRSVTSNSSTAAESVSQNQKVGAGGTATERLPMAPRQGSPVS